MAFYASKLPHGLKIEHDGQTVILNGANIGEDLANPSNNGSPREHRRRLYGYGLTELPTAKAEAFEAWKLSVTTKDGQKVANGFAALENGAILGPFRSIADAEKEIAAMSGIVTTGFEGVDPVKEAKKKDGVKTRED